MMSLSNIRSLRLANQKIPIGEYAVDKKAEEQAEGLIGQAYPELSIITTVEGKKQIPLQQLVVLDERIESEKKSIYEKRYEDGYRAGYESGQAAGLAEGQKDARQIVASLSGVLSEIKQQRQVVLEDARQKILEMVLKISEKLTFSAARIDSEMTMSIINGAIDQLLDKKKLIVKVNPDHLPEIEQHIERFRGQDTAIKEFRLEGDPRVRRGGCFIETPAGDIDARLESMFDIIKQTILGIEDSVQ
jgi:flagellar assembly protein FliH